MSRMSSPLVTLSGAKGTMAAFGAFAPLRLTAMLLLAITACGDGEPDAYGNFEATEVTVAAEVGGRLLAFRPGGGRPGERRQRAGRGGHGPAGPRARGRGRPAGGGAGARPARPRANISALEVQRTIADRELARTERLLKQAAATAQQGDRAERDARVVAGAARPARTRGQGQRAAGGRGARRPGGARSTTGCPGAGSEARSPARCSPATSSRASSCSRASRCSSWLRSTRSPSAPTSTSAQLTALRLGQEVKVGVDRADSIVTLPGRVTWIASAAEFTPDADPDAGRAGRPGVRGEDHGRQSGRAGSGSACRASSCCRAGRSDE